MLTVLSIIGSVGGWLLDYAKKKSDAAVEMRAIDAGVTVADLKANAAVIQTAMGHKMFWVPWSIAAIPLSMWFGWGMLDSLMNGALPDVAALPPQLKAYADVAWGNIFYTGGGVVGLQIAARTISNGMRRR